MRSSCVIQIGLKSSDKCPAKKEAERDRRRSGPRGRDWSHAAVSLGLPAANSSWKRHRTDSPQRTDSRERGPVTLWFQTSVLQKRERTCFCCFKSVVLCYSSRTKTNARARPVSCGCRTLSFPAGSTVPSCLCYVTLSPIGCKPHRGCSLTFFVH